MLGCYQTVTKIGVKQAEIGELQENWNAAI